MDSIKETRIEGFPRRSNCLIGALLIKWRFGGRLCWRPGWRKEGWDGFLNNPWGHFRVRIGNKILSYSSLDTGEGKYQFSKHPILRQLWFLGYVKSTDRKKDE